MAATGTLLGQTSVISGRSDKCHLEPQGRETLVLGAFGGLVLGFKFTSAVSILYYAFYLHKTPPLLGHVIHPGANSVEFTPMWFFNAQNSTGM